MTSCNFSRQEGQNVTTDYIDGNYCATVTYHNPQTGTSSDYELSVEVEDDQVIAIHWPNGGWLDDSHFTPEEIDQDGSVSFTSDRGYEYSVHLHESEPRSCN